jgi:hypothetical protein
MKIEFSILTYFATEKLIIYHKKVWENCGKLEKNEFSFFPLRENFNFYKHKIPYLLPISKRQIFSAIRIRKVVRY